jgi:hypothetical protein
VIGNQYLESVRETHHDLEEARPEIEGRADRFQYLCYEFGLRFFRDLAENVAQVIQGLEEEETGG